MPRHPDPELEQEILAAASRLWARGGEKALTMRAVAKAAGTTTPTVYERYRDRDDILRALRLQTRMRLFAGLSRTRTLREAVQHQLDFAMENSQAYQVLFDGVAKPPSLHEAWPSFNLIRERIADQVSEDSDCLNRLMMAIWSLMHGTAMLIIRGGFEGALRLQTVHACLDTLEAVVAAARKKTLPSTGPKWPASLVLGEGKQSRAGNGGSGTGVKEKKRKRRASQRRPL